MSQPQGTQRTQSRRQGSQTPRTPAVGNTRAPTPAPAAGPSRTRPSTPSSDNEEPKFKLPEFIWPKLPADTFVYDTNILSHYQWPEGMDADGQQNIKAAFQEASNQISRHMWNTFMNYIERLDRNYQDKIENVEVEKNELLQRHESLTEEVNNLTKKLQEVDLFKAYRHEVETVETSVNDLEKTVDTLTRTYQMSNNRRKDDIARVQRQLDSLPVGGLDHGGVGRSKMPDPPMFSGSESKLDV